MKKLIFFCTILVTSAVVYATKLPNMSVLQTIQYQGGQYATMSIPAIHHDAGIVNVRYDFTVIGKDNKRAVVDCRIVLPADFDVHVLSTGGIQKLETKDKNGSAMALTAFPEGNSNIIEFLIPQETSGEHFIEFQFDASKLNVGRDVPIYFDFTSYQQNWFKKNWPTIAGSVVGVAAGVVTTVLTFNAGAGAAAGTAAGSAVAASAAVAGVNSVLAGIGISILSAGVLGAGGYVLGEQLISPETMNEIKSGYKGTQIGGRYQYTLQIIE